MSMVKFLNPVVANMHNVKTNRFHPIAFREAPLPGCLPNGGFVRLKSIMHHTEGFMTRREAIVSCRELAKDLEAKLCIEKDIQWDRKSGPVKVIFLAELESFAGKSVGLDVKV